MPHADLTEGAQVEVVVTVALYACCGRGWQSREGYEQTYRGRVAEDAPGRWRLTAAGIGTISYVVIFAVGDLLDTRAV